MNKIISVALLVAGIILIVWGVSAMDSFSSDMSRIFTGSPSDKAVWLLVPGIAAAIAGLLGLLRSLKKG
ncbi:MAG: DUF3185 family protein [Fidelibacterota bacterium]